jgi:hypothetical protein
MNIVVMKSLGVLGLVAVLSPMAMLASGRDATPSNEKRDIAAAADRHVTGETAKVTGAFIVPKEVASFDGRTVEIQLYKIHPMLADKAADLVDTVQIPNFAHTGGTETKTEFTIGAKAKLETDMKYYITLFILKDGQRTHMGQVPGKFLCTVLTQGEPNQVALTVSQVR